MYTKSALDVYARCGILTKDKVRKEKVRLPPIDENVPKRDFLHPVGDGT